MLNTAWKRGAAVIGGLIVIALIGNVYPDIWIWVGLGLVGLAIYAKMKHKHARSLGRPVHTRTIPQDVKVAVAARDGGRCAHCGSFSELQFDHVVPYSLGGSSTDPNNIQLLCRKCNQDKSNRFIG